MRTSFKIAGSLFLAAVVIASLVDDADARRRWRRHFRSAPPVQTETLGMQRGDGSVCQSIRADVEAALAACTRLIESSRVDPKGRFLATFFRAQGYTLKGEYDNALRDFDDAIKINDVLRINTGGRIFQGRGWAFANKGELERAIADYDEAIKQAPDAAAFFVDRGVAHSKLSNIDQAIQDFDEAIRLENKLPSAYLQRAIAYQKKGAIDLAIRDLNDAIGINNKYVQAYNLRGEFNVEKGDLDRGLRDFEEAIRVDSTYVPGYLNRGYTYVKLEQYDRAIRDFDRVTSLEPRSPRGYIGRATAYEKKEDLVNARRDYDEALDLDPRNKAALEGRATVYFKRGDVRRGLEDARDLARLDRRDLAPPTDYETAMKAGNFLYNRKQFAECIEVLTRAVERIDLPQKSDFELFVNRASCYSETKQLDKAEGDLRKALDFNPDQPRVLERLGLTMIERGSDLEGGFQLIVRAAELSKQDDGKILDSLGLALYKLNRFEESVRALRRASDLSPKEVSVHEHLGDAFWKLNRKPEAYRSWENARSLMSDKFDLVKIDEKIRFGLDRPQQSSLLPPAPEPQPQQPPRNQSTFIPPQNPPQQLAPKLPESVVPRTVERRVALVIGMSEYKNVSPLANPRRDAEAVATTLRGLGFQVTIKLNLSYGELNAAMVAFSKEASAADWAMVYYAGHGIEIAGQNYLVPADARLAADKDVQYEAMPLDLIQNAVQGAKKLRLVILDACRDNPFLKNMERSLGPLASRSIHRGLGGIDPVSGTLIFYAAKAGQVALDGTGGQNSPFVTSLLRQMQTPGLEVTKTFRLVRDDVMRETGNQQEPYFYGSVGGEDLYFVANK